MRSMRWPLALAGFVAATGCAVPGSGPQALTLEYVSAQMEGAGPTDPIWVVVRATHTRDEAITLDREDFTLRDADDRTYEFYDGYALADAEEGAARLRLPFDAEPGRTYEVHLQGYLVGAAPPESPMTVKWSEGVERASATFPWPPR